MPPCECSVTFLLRWRATTGNPNRSNRLLSNWGSGAVYSTNSNPSVPMGLVSNENLAAITGLRREIDLVSIVTNEHAYETPLGEFSPLPAVGLVQYREWGDRRCVLFAFRPLDSRMARHGRSGRQSRAFRGGSHRPDSHGQGGREPGRGQPSRCGPAAAH